jgi:hypothetical protein
VARRLSVDLSGAANFQPSETGQDNYTLVQTLGAGVTFEVTSRLNTGLHTVYRRVAYGQQDAGRDEKRLDNQMAVQVRADYRVFRYTTVYVSAETTQNSSSAAEAEYQRQVLQTGVNLVF